MSEVISLAAKRPLVIYTVSICQDWEGSLSVSVYDLQDDPRSRQAVADALRRAADAIEDNIQ